jgi:hypothetical protein
LSAQAASRSHGREKAVQPRGIVPNTVGNDCIVGQDSAHRVENCQQIDRARHLDGPGEFFPVKPSGAAPVFPVPAGIKAGQCRRRRIDIRDGGYRRRPDAPKLLGIGIDMDQPLGRESGLQKV